MVSDSEHQWPCRVPILGCHTDDHEIVEKTSFLYVCEYTSREAQYIGENY